MGLEALYFLGAFALLVTLIYASLSYRYRNLRAVQVGEEVTRERYKNNQT